MKYKEAIKQLPPGVTVSIGCRKGAGWFYFTKSDDLKTETEIIFKIMDEKMKKSLNQMKYNLPNLKRQIKDDKFIKNVSLTGYLRLWDSIINLEKRIPKAWMEYSQFNIIELMNADVSIRHKMDGSIGIIFNKWKVSGDYWTKKEWEGKHGTI